MAMSRRRKGRRRGSLCGVIITKYLQDGVFDTATSHLGEEREKVAWSADGVFADLT
jgi:hypothetical protein